MLGSPRLGSPRRSESSAVGSISDNEVLDKLMDLGLYIPEPNFEVSEESVIALGGQHRFKDDIVYKIDLDFGEMGGWSIYVTRSNLTALASTVQLRKAFGGHHLGGRLVKRASALNLQRQESTLHPRLASSQQPSARPIVMRQYSTDYFGGQRPRGASETDDKHKSNVMFGLSKLLFVPAVGGPQRIRKVRDDRLRLVESIFSRILHDEHARNSDKVKEYLRISNVTFDTRFGKSFKEGWVKASVHPRASDDEKLQWKGKVSCGCCICACAPDPSRCRSCLQPQFRRKRRYWAVVKSSFIALYASPPCEIDPRSANVVATFSRHFETFKGYSTTGSHRTITIVEHSKIIKLKFPTRWEKKIWSQAILAAFDASHADSEQCNKVEWSGMHAFQSFAPKRFDEKVIDSEICRAQWHIDGSTTYAAMLNALESAESQIFIMGWWVCPSLPLVRPATVGDYEKSLAGVLERKAVDGVQVVVLMYNEVSVALSLDSAHQEKELRRLSCQENIHILRHPAHKLKVNSTWFWSHHEKLVIVDQNHAFCGGLDLCWGRYDTNEHKLFEPVSNEEIEKEWPGIDYYNVRVRDFDNVHQPDRAVYQEGTPRMPWHDIHCEYMGAIARDLARHFIHQWNHARFTLTRDKYTPELVPMDHLPMEFLHGSELSTVPSSPPPPLPKNIGGIGMQNGVDAHNLSTVLDRGARTSESQNGANQNDEEVNSQCSDRTITEEDLDDLEDEEAGLVKAGEVELKATNGFTPEEDAAQATASSQLLALSSSLQPQTERDDPKQFGYSVDCQVVRSLGLWSGASPGGGRECSIEKAMRSIIDSARRFVYIENQFFISGLESDSLISNRVLESMYRRIVRAHESKSDFKIFVTIPLLPGFDNFVEDSPSIRRVLYFQYRSISRGGYSLFYHLLSAGINPDDYICFLGLRTWEEDAKKEKIATEQIYVHSKLLIADDSVCIIGSGNINERSLTGNRDTEVAVVIRNCSGRRKSCDDVASLSSYHSDMLDKETTPDRDDSFVRSFRLALFKEHWGDHPSLEQAISDPVAGFPDLQYVAHRNTDIYDEYFRCLPRNDVRDAFQLRAFSQEKFSVIDYDERVIRELKKIRGHVVSYPQYFLSDYDLKPGLIRDSAGTILGDELYI